MRNAIAILLLIPAISMGAENLVFSTDMAQESKPIVLSTSQAKTSMGFSLNGLALDTTIVDGQQYTKISPLEIDQISAGQLALEGQPDLPCYSSLVIIPDQAGVQVNIISADYQTVDNVDIAPVQPPELESGAPVAATAPFTKDFTTYATNEFYPQELVHLGEPMIMRDFRFIQTTVQPVQYNPVTRQLRVYTNVNYELVYSSTDSRNPLVRRDNDISEAFVPLYKSLFANAEMLLANYSPVRGGYLILVPNNVQFMDSLVQLLADWKSQKGYYVKVTKSNEIPRIGANPTNLEVKSYIQTAYDTWGTKRPDYVCILGDIDITNSIANYPYKGYDSDQSYSQVAGGDYIPDIFVMRMSVRDQYDLSCLVHKTIYYEKTPYNGADNGYWKRGLVVAGNYGVNSPTTPRITTLWVRELLINNGYTQVDSVFDWGSGAPNLSTINTALNNGVSIVAYRGYAGPGGWIIPSYSTTELGNRTPSPKIGIMTSIVCGTGDYSATNCFGEQYIRGGTAVGDTSYRGGPCFFGSSNTGTNTRWNNPIMVGFYNSLFDAEVYHFGQNMVAGKLRMYLTFPRFVVDSSMVQEYFNTYNSLGDPELEIRTDIPRSMIASYSASIPVGTNFLSLHITNAGGSPLAGAYVCLYKDTVSTDTIQVGGLTNSNGDITLNFRNTGTGHMHVTVTARNYTPHVGICNSTSQTVTLGSDTTFIDDDNSGGSHGNSDGKPNPHETLGLNIRLKNYGTSATATGITTDLTSLDSRVTVTTGHQTYADIAVGGSALPAGQFFITLADSIPHNKRLPLQLAVTSAQGSWQTQVVLTASSIVADSFSITYSGNNILDPGETVRMAISWKNKGGLAAENVTGVLSCTDPYVTIPDANGTFGNIPINGTGNNGTDSFQVALRDSAFDGRIVTFTVSFTANISTIGTVKFRNSFIDTVGTVGSTDPTGPDAYGYYAYDNTDVSYVPHPTYSWIEINPSLGGSGQRLTFPNNNVDDASTLIGLPYPIKYYGQTYSHMIVSINGFAAFDTVPYDVAGNYWFNFANWPIPDPGNARAQISPFWDDLKIAAETAGVYTYLDGANGRFIVEWSNLRHANRDSLESFQMILYDGCRNRTPTGDCEIVFQYNHIVNNDSSNTSDPDHPENYSSIGIENWQENIGLQYEYDNYYSAGAAPLVNGRAIKFTTARFALPPPSYPSESHSPSSITMQCPAGGQTSSQLIISNSGYCDLGYVISPESLGYLRPRAEIIPKNEQIIPTASADLAKDAEIYTPNPPVITSHGGPDSYGHTWKDSDDPGGPTYGWVDISGVGTPVTLSDDNNIGPIAIGFDFPFYQNTYNSLYIGSNGGLTFNSGYPGSSNSDIPSTGTPNDMIAMWWDDLDPPHQGNVYYYYDVANHRFIVSYVNIAYYYTTTPGYTGTSTFQALLYDDGRMIFQYGTMDPGLHPSGLQSASIGIENSDGTVGLKVVYNAAYMHSNLAILISVPPPPPTALNLNPNSGIVSPGTNDTVAVIARAESTASGQYNWQLNVQTSDPNAGHSAYNVPVTINVSGGSPDGYVKGTVKEVDNTTPIQGVVVTTYGAGHVLVATDTTNASGQYLMNLPPATYSEEFRKGNYRDTTIASLSVVSNDTTRVTMLMTHKPGYIEGTVKKQDNMTPIQGVIVRAHNAQDTLKGTDTTDAAGKFLFTLAAGTYHEHFAKTGYLDTTLTNTVVNWAESTHVTMLLRTAPPQCSYLQGDINGDDLRGGGDVTYGVRFFKLIGNRPPDSCYMDSTGGYLYVAGDVNGNCEFRGSDISRLVSYFKSVASLSYCHFFPPPPAIVGYPAKQIQKDIQEFKK
jgi:hypothetical protein